MTFDALVDQPPFGMTAAEKERRLLPDLNAMGRHHYAHCAPYRKIADAIWGEPQPAEQLCDLPYLPVSIFKEIELSSIATPTMVLQSSGTSGQRPSRIVIDGITAQRQARALVATFRGVLGTSRLPLLVIDTRKVISDPKSLSARGAGILGMMKFGARSTFALDDDLASQRDVIGSFVQKYGGAPFFLFGFTFLVWKSLFEAYRDGELDLSNATLIHSGGWKKMEADKVTNAVFRSRMATRFNLTRIYNFYGFVEQIGSIFLEGPDGLLYAPNFADIIVRDPESWAPAPAGQPGVIQVVSLLPLSYPGHSVLTEDLGVIETVDAGTGGRLGKAARIIGRVPRTELRGCSDVIATAYS
ncbi:MAG: hypothetical protein P4M00_04620 [Azospirillaceae bacterium]|nr:hypothetical protein [Azospirillaceae bacterium]